MLENKGSMAQVVVEQDVRLKTGAIEIPPSDDPIQAYFAKPKNSGKRPAVIVIHENRGLNPVDVSFFICFLRLYKYLLSMFINDFAP